MEQFRHDTRDQVFAWFRIKRHAHHFLSWRIASRVFLEQEEREKMVKEKKKKGKKEKSRTLHFLFVRPIVRV